MERINRYFRDVSLSVDPYLRGRVIAVWLDQQIRNRSSGKISLDKVMNAMVREASRPLTQRRIVETAGRYIYPESRAELLKLIVPGSSAPRLDHLSIPCVGAAFVERAPFDLGFNLAASRATGILTHVERDGPAYRAGLWDGQRLGRRLSVLNREPHQSVAVGISTGDGEKIIRYLPPGTPRKVTQFYLDLGDDSAVGTVR